MVCVTPLGSALASPFSDGACTCLCVFRLCSSFSRSEGRRARLVLVAMFLYRSYEADGGERGIRTPGTRWVQQISSLPHSTTLPSLRGRRRAFYQVSFSRPSM